MKEVNHIDGVWRTSEYLYKECKILIKSAYGKGIKAHCFYPNSEKVKFTLRYSYIKPKQLLEKVKKKIDNINKQNETL